MHLLVVRLLSAYRDYVHGLAIVTIGHALLDYGNATLAHYGS